VVRDTNKVKQEREEEVAELWIIRRSPIDARLAYRDLWTTVTNWCFRSRTRRNDVEIQSFLYCLKHEK
jgi:hypothetical protein